jgi:protein transport protein HofC
MTLDYRSANLAPERRRQLFSWAAFLALLIPIVLIYAVMEFFVPRLETIYKDFGTRLPTETQIVLDIARWGSHWGYIPALAVPIGIGFLAPLLNLGDPPEVRRTRSRWILPLIVINVCVVLLIIVFTAVVITPWFNLMQNISGRR